MGELKTIQQEIFGDSLKWFGEEVATDLITAVLGINGEAGECAEVIKKLLRGTLPHNNVAYSRLAEEICDTFIYCMLAMEVLGLDMEEVYREKREINIERFSHEGGTDQSSLAAEVRKQQQVPLGATSFVPGSSLQGEVHKEPPI